MYAVIATGGKQEKVIEGQFVQVERLREAEIGATVRFTPLLIVGNDDVVSARPQLDGAIVEGEVIAEVKGPKIRGFTYKNKSNQSRRWGHRQNYTQVRITRVAATGNKEK